jgi:hypothetical protein
MSTLRLDTTLRAVLTRTEKVPSPVDPTATVTVSYPCDLRGEKIVPPAQPIPIFLNLIDGKHYAKVFEKPPAGTSTLGLIHYADDNVNGYFTLAPDFNQREKVDDSAAPDAAKQAPSVPVTPVQTAA